MEQWKEIPFNKDYEVSNLGNVKSLKFGRELTLKPSISTAGYYQVLLHDRKQTNHLIHQLVAIAFLNHTPCGKSLVVNHKDLNKLNNNVANLEIITMRENSNLKHLPNQSSKYVGVTWHKRILKWQSRIVISKKRVHLGYFKNEIDAHNAYENKLKEII